MTAPAQSTPVYPAANPISPPGVYLADPSARVWQDGRLYLYGSKDESSEYYCSNELVALSTDNLTDWVLHEGLLRTDGDGEVEVGTDAYLYAPDCIYRNNEYSLYFCTPDKNYIEGVATSHSPTGPFKNAQKMDLPDHLEIDPAVFIDDDGQAYYLWGQFSLKMAKLAPDMKSVQPDSVITDLLTEKEHHFHEGAFLFKRKDLYYLVYADISRADMPTCIGYATSQNPMGPYTYRGVIIDNRMCNPGNWNNHGSVARFKDQWYVFYHRSTHGCNTMRKACAEPICFDGNGFIPEVEMTTQGAGTALSAYQLISAARACLLMNGCIIQSKGSGREILTKLTKGTKAAFKYINFESGASGGAIRLKTGREETEIWLMADQVWDHTIARIKIPPSKNRRNEWQTIPFEANQEIQGERALWIYVQKASKAGIDVDWIQFEGPVSL